MCISFIMVNAEGCRNGTICKVMNKTFFLCVIIATTITGCTDPPNTSVGTAPGSSAPVTTTGTTTTGTTTAYLPTPAAAPAPVVPPTSENYGLYTDSDLQVYADTLDVRIQQALKNNNSSEAQTLGVKRQELIAEFNRRGLKRHPVESTPGPRYSRKVDHGRTRVSQPRTKVNSSGAGLPGED
jgi:hypothetical protein